MDSRLATLNIQQLSVKKEDFLIIIIIFFNFFKEIYHELNSVVKISTT